MDRNKKGFNNALTDTFDIMRISRRQKLVGSASILGNIITNDYDLNEIFDEEKTNPMDSLTRLYFMFIWKFKKIYTSSNLWIVDFKCGSFNGEPIRWTMKDLERGYIELRSVANHIGGFTAERILFVDCLVQSNTKTKLDVVLLLNNRFIEISEIYFIRINNKSNFNENDFRLGTIINELYDDMQQLIIEKNIFKSLKREYRILSLLDRDKNRQEVLSQLFNGKYGYLYYTISQLKTLIIMKEQTFKPVEDAIFLQVQQVLKDDISKILNYNYAFSKLNEPIDNVKIIETIISYLTEYLNFRIQKIAIKSSLF